MPEFRHAQDSDSVCIPGERPDALDCLRADLAAEHRPPKSFWLTNGPSTMGA